jgi:hypothetical protein
VHEGPPIQCTFYRPNGPDWPKMILQKSAKKCIFSVFHVFHRFLENELSPIRAGGATQVACLHARVDLSIAYFIDQLDLIGKS